MLLSIIIVSFNTSQLLQNCLQSVYRTLKKGNLEDSSEVIVVDNASSDGSIEIIEKNFPKVVLIKNNHNLGFAKANNQALRKATGKYILLLNSDTEVKNDALTKLLETIKNDDNIGVVGGKLLNPDGSIQPSAGFFPNLNKVFFWMFLIDDIPLLRKVLKPYHIEEKSFYEKIQMVDWVTGACFMLRREVTEHAGLLDENIFMYGEELEWCYRIKKMGWQILYTPEAQILHLKGSSAHSKEAGIAEEFKAILYFYKKHQPNWQIPLVKLFLICGALLRLAVFGIIGRYRSRLSLYAKAIEVVR